MTKPSTHDATEEADPTREPDPAESQRSKIERRRRATASVIHDTILVEGAEELERPVNSLFWSGLAAGLAMGFSLVVEGLLQSGLLDASWRPLVANLGLRPRLRDRGARATAALH